MPTSSFSRLARDLGYQEWALDWWDIQGLSSILSGLPRLSPAEPPAQVTLKLQPPRVFVGEVFTIECKVSPVQPLERLTLSLLRGRETLKNQTFGGAETVPQEATATFNSTALKKDGLNFSCQAELDLRPHGGYIIRSISEYQILEVYGKETLSAKRLRGNTSWQCWERKLTSPTPRWSDVCI